jgi:hypothetical protein
MHVWNLKPPPKNVYAWPTGHTAMNSTQQFEACVAHIDRRMSGMPPETFETCCRRHGEPNTADLSALNIQSGPDKTKQAGKKQFCQHEGVDQGLDRGVVNPYAQGVTNKLFYGLRTAPVVRTHVFTCMQICISGSPGSCILARSLSTAVFSSRTHALQQIRSLCLHE